VNSSRLMVGEAGVATRRAAAALFLSRVSTDFTETASGLLAERIRATFSTTGPSVCAHAGICIAC
jgi:hypothetical protein